MNKNLTILTLIFLVAVLLMNTIFGWFTLNKDERIAKDALKPKTDTIRLIEYVARDSTVYVKYNPNEGELMSNNITRNYNTYVYDTLAPTLKIAAEKITEQQRIIAKLEGRIKANEAKMDKDRITMRTYEDKYFTAITKTDTLGNSEMDYKYNAYLDITTTTDKNLFRKDVQSVYITSPDKNFRVNNVEHYKKSFEIPNRRFGVGFHLGYGITGSGELTPILGVGLNYNVLKF